MGESSFVPWAVWRVVHATLAEDGCILCGGRLEESEPDGERADTQSANADWALPVRRRFTPPTAPVEQLDEERPASL